MRIARKLMLLAVTAAAAMAFAATPASATEEVDVVTNPGGAPCSFATCTIHVTGEVELSAIIFGFEVHEGDCIVEMDMQVDSDANGRVTGFNEIEDTAGTHDANCFHGPVAVGESFPWIGRGEEDSNGVVGMTAAVDVDPTESAECTGNVNLNIVEPTAEKYAASFTNSRIGSSVCEITGQLTSEGNPVHINHP